MNTAVQKRGLLSGAFADSRWDSRIKSANTTGREMWLGYVLGVWGMMMTSSIVNSYYNQYLTDVLGFDSSKGLWIATFMVLFPVLSKVIDAITNLAMAKIIDSTTCRQGKVRPWLIISSPFVLITVILLFWMPFAEPAHQAIWICIAFNLYYSVAYTMWNMSKELLPAVSTRNVNQRKNLSMAAQIVGSAGTGAVSIFFPSILAAVCRMVHGDNAKGYFLSMSVLAAVAVCTTFIQYFYTRERVTEERRSQVGLGNAGEKHIEVNKEAPMLTQFKACLTSKTWIVFIVMILIFYVCNNLRNISLIYYSGWVVNGNAYGRAAAIQAKFQAIALSPMGPGILVMLPLVKKVGRTKAIWTTSILTAVGALIAFLNIGHGSMIYAGTALQGIGNICFSYMVMTFLGDVIDQVEWKTGVRADGLTGGFISAVMTFAVGIAQGIFNFGLMATGYTKPLQIGMDGDIILYADQPASAINWINMAYQGSFFILGIAVVIVFCFLFKIEDEMPVISRELQERRVAECAALGIEYIPAEERERREREEADRMAEEIRIQELRKKCEKQGLDFDTENGKVLAKRAAKKAKAEQKAAKKKGKKKIVIGILCVAAILLVAQLVILGAKGGIGPLKFLKNNQLAKEPGNAAEFAPENVTPLEDSPLKGKKLLFLGSSVTYGYASMQTSMADYLAILDGCEVTKEAVNGTTLAGSDSSTYVSRLMKVDKGQAFDALICQLSTNDASKGSPLGEMSDSFDIEDFDRETVIGALETIIAYAKESWNCPVIIYTGTRFDSEPYEAMVDALPALQEKWGVGVLDLWNDEEMNAVSDKDYHLYMHDDVHPTRAGYLRWWVPKFESYLYDYLGE